MQQLNSFDLPQGSQGSLPNINVSGETQQLRNIELNVPQNNRLYEANLRQNQQVMNNKAVQGNDQRNMIANVMNNRTQTRNATLQTN